MSAIDWSQVEVGDLVLGNDGNEWSVSTLSESGEVTIERVTDGHTYSGAPAGRVERLATAAQVHERAVAVAQVHLGGQVVAEKSDDPRGWRTPATYVDPGALAAHIHLMHGESVAHSATRAQLRTLHDQLHAPGATPGANHVDHWHDEAFFEQQRLAA